MGNSKEEGTPYQQLQSIQDVSTSFNVHDVVSNYSKSTSLNSFAEIAENKQGSKLTLVHQRTSADSGYEEVILRVQGYLLEANLPPVRRTE